MKKTIDIRMNTKFAGKKIFLEKFDYRCFQCYWWERMKKKTHKKLNVSIPIELHDFLIQKQKTEQAKNPLATIPLSKIVATAIEELKHDEQGNAQDVSAVINPRLKTSAGGSSTRGTARSRKAG